MDGKQLLLIPLLFIGIVIGHAQTTSEFEGKVKITQLDADNSADSLVVKLPDGTLGLRGANSITSFQVLSISNDTLFLSNDGVVDNTVDLSMYKELPASRSPGEILYWDGAAWTIVAATVNEAATLQMIGGVPTWVGGTPPPPSVTSTTGAIWMDRNLGATQVATMSNDAASYGDLYQWGRDSDGHQIRTSGTTSTLSVSDVPGHGNWILATVSPYDWRSGQNDNLWQGVNGINNPCPSGYRIPTEAEWEAERASWVANDNSTGAFTSPLKLPVAGARSFSNGSLFSAGSGGYYWSSTVSGTISRYLYFDSGNAYVNANFRAFGLSVRCLKD